MTDGVMRSFSAFGIICGFPYMSMCETAQKVVPRSIPTAFLRVILASKLQGLVSDNSAPCTGAIFMPAPIPNSGGFSRQKE
jgi:hypothetical protein